MREVSADKAYSSAKNLKLVAYNIATPYIPFKSNSKPTHWLGPSGIWRDMFHYYNYKQDEFMRHYHKRSNVETTFSMIKRKFGDKARSKTLVAQTNEVLCKVLCHNLCVLIQSMYELGIEVSFGTKS